MKIKSKKEEEEQQNQQQQQKKIVYYYTMHFHIRFFLYKQLVAVSMLSLSSSSKLLVNQYVVFECVGVVCTT